MQATAGALVPHPRKSIKRFSAYKIPELLVESEPKLDFAKEWPEEAASHVRAVHKHQLTASMEVVGASLERKCTVEMV